MSSEVTVILNGSSPDTVSKGTCCPDERDLCALLWDTLAKPGITRHVCRPISLSPDGKTLEMERMHGLGNDVVNMEQLLHAAADGGVPEEEFAALFKTLIFQTIFTLSMCTYAFHGLFRHNDLHLKNVCFTPWNKAKAKVDAAYTLPCFPESSDEPFINRHFYVPSVYRAVMIDYGWSALLPGLGPDKDSRFYRADDVSRSLRPLMVDILTSDASLKDCGMSQRVSSHHYDVALFMFSVFSVCHSIVRRSRAPKPIEVHLSAFIDFYKRMYDGVPMVAGRIPLGVQVHLLKSKTLPSSTKVVPTPELLLLDSYFDAFRCDESESRSKQHVFGIHPSKAAMSNETIDRPDDMTFLAGKGTWTRHEKEWMPPFGRYSSLVAQVNKNVATWRLVRKRELNDDEAIEWKKTESKVLSEKDMQPVYCSPVHSPLLKVERIVAKSPKNVFC